jgi:hypothetical protein
VTTELKTSPDLDELVRQLPPHLRENFEKADTQVRDLYGVSPGVTALMRLWLACGTSSQIRVEFERAVLDIKRRDFNPNEEGDFDEDSL